MLVTLGHTPNFNIQYDNKLKDGKRRAKALKSTIPVGIPLTWYPPDGPGRALISASGSYLG